MQLTFGCNAEQESLFGGLKEFLANEAGLTANLGAHALTHGFSPDLFRRMAKFELFGLAVPSTVGGSGLSFFELGLLASGLGHELVGGPWLETLTAIQLLCRTSDTEKVVARLVAGDELVSVPLRKVDWTSGPTASVGEGDRLSLTGHVTCLGFADGVDSWIIPARPARPAGTHSIVVTRLRPVRVRTPMLSIDPLWRGVALDLSDEPAEFLCEIQIPEAQEIWDDIAALLAMNELGAAARLLNLSVSYLKERTQFGQPVGSFQAMKHLAANVFIELEHIQHLAAAACSPADTDDRHLAVAMAKVAADGAYRRAGEAALQMHGGIGFTWEVPVHYFLKAALRQRMLPVSTIDYLAILRERLGLE